jgi:hypothetical protein
MGLRTFSTGSENPVLFGIQTTDHPSHIKSLYPLLCPTHVKQSKKYNSSLASFTFFLVLGRLRDTVEIKQLYIAFHVSKY